MRVDIKSDRRDGMATVPASEIEMISDADLSRLRAAAIGLRTAVAETPLVVPPRTMIREIRRKLHAGRERWIYGTRELCIYVVSFEDASKLPKMNFFRRNSVDDLLCYRRTSLSQPSRRDFLKLVESRLRRGMSVYTYVEDGVLRSYLWLDPNPESYFGSGVDQEISAVPNSVYVQDAFTDPSIRSKGLAQAGFCQVAHDAIAMEGKTSLYLAIFSWNKPSRHGVEKLGGIHKTSYFCKTRFGRRKTWKTEY